MKKILALLLSVCMTVGMGSSVFAYSDVEEGTKVSEAVTLLTDLEILDGFEDGTFKPEQTITRAEMAKIICEMLNAAAVPPSAPVFDDVPVTHWAAGYINTVANLGIVCGYGDGNYGPEDTVTYEEAVKMIVCALGYEPMAATKGGWSAGYISVASSIGLLKNMSSSNRGDIAVLVYNALHTPVMEQTSFGTNETYEPLDGTNGTSYKTLLTERDVYIATGVVGEIYNNDRVEFTVSRNSEDGEFKKSDTPIVFYIGNSSIVDYTHQEVKVYVENDDDDYTVIAVVATAKTETLTILSDDIVSINNGVVKYYIDANNSTKTKTVNVDDKAVIEFNKNTDDVKNLSFFEDREDITITFVENDGDSSYDAVIATYYISERLSKVDASRDKITLSNKTVECDFDDDDKTYIFVDEEGNELDLSDFAEDDVIAYMCDDFTDTKGTITFNAKEADYLKIVLLADSAIVGEVDSVGSDYITIDGEEYDVVNSIWDEVSTPGTEGTFYVGMTGKIIDFDGSTATANYGYVLRIGASSSSFDDTVIVEMLTTKGVKQYETTTKATANIKDLFGSNNVTWKTVTADENRLVTYKVNSSGKVSQVEAITKGTFKPLAADTYKADLESIKGAYLDEDTLVFMINDTDTDKLFVTNMDSLVDEGKYTGLAYIKNGDTEVIIVSDTDSDFNSENGFAIVTGVSTMSVDGDKVIAVSYVQNEEADVVYFDDDTDVDEDTFDVGTIFTFNVAADGYVNKYMIIADVVNNTNFAIRAYDVDTEPNGYKRDKLDDDVEVLIGYIFNDTSKTNNKGELITFSTDGKVETDTYVVSDDAYMYTYKKTNRKYTIETEDFLAGDAYYREVETDDVKDVNIVTPVFIKLIDDVVVDIYTISSRVEIGR